MNRIEFLNLKNPTWRLGDTYWTERPDFHFRRRLVYKWEHEALGFKGEQVVFIPNIDSSIFIRAMNSRGNRYKYTLVRSDLLASDEIERWNAAQR